MNWTKRGISNCFVLLFLFFLSKIKMFLPFYHGTSEEVRKKEQGIAFRRDFFFETTGPETWKPTMHGRTVWWIPVKAASFIVLDKALYQSI